MEQTTTNAPAGPLVRCPSCGDMKPYLRDNPYRPFCSRGCQAIDLGAWASEQYRMTPTSSAAEDSDLDQTPQ